MKAERARREDGSALVLVLIFISVAGLILSGLLTESSASFGFSNAVSSHEDKVYAADAGVTFGIQQLRQNNELCPAPATSGPPIPNITVNSQTVTVSCDDASGFTNGGLGYAIITTSTGADSLTTQGAANEQKNIGGPVYASGPLGLQADLNIVDGNFYQQKQGGTCAKTGSGDLTTTAPYGFYCTTAARPDPPNVPPTRPTNLQLATGDGDGSCRTFSPGLYTAKPQLVANNYFRSGVYYFNFNDTFSIGDNVYGGQPSTETRRFTSPPPCADDGSDPAGTVGTGVEWILGGTGVAGAGARLYIGNGGHLELFRRTGETVGTNNISILSVPNTAAWTGAGWFANQVPNTTRILDMANGNTHDAVTHGMIYAPGQSVGLNATNNTMAQALGGVVAYRVDLQASASVSGFVVSVETGLPEPRQIRIIASAPGTSAGEAPVVSTAIVEIANDAAQTSTVKSWRTQVPGD